MTLYSLIAVALGGAVGALARFGIFRLGIAVEGVDTAWFTLGINAVGSFGLGLAAYLLGEKVSLAQPFVMVGLLGAFTTFSTFALDAVVLFRDRGAQAAGLYLFLSVSLSVIAVVLGLMTGRALS
ncbi:MAG: fluoride efflux transporter FluC [Parvularcula sp.]